MMTCPTPLRLTVLAFGIFLTLSLMAVPKPVAAEPIKVVTEEAYYSYIENGKVVGMATEVVEKTFQRAEIHDYKISLYPWARAYNIALTEPNVLIYLIVRTEEREPLFKWVGEVMRERYYFYKLRDRADLMPKDLKAASKLSIGVMRDDVRHQYLKKQGFSRLVISAQPRENLTKLFNHQVDLIPLTEQEVQGNCDEAKLDCTKMEKALAINEIDTALYMAFSAKTPDATVDRARLAFQELQANGTVRRIIGPDAAPPPATLPSKMPNSHDTHGNPQKTNIKPSS
jgi:polar amino acid transport system substrate-binding protein